MPTQAKPTQAKPTQAKPAPDLTSVRTLIPSVSKLAKHLNLSVNSIYRWIAVNRIPGAHVIKVANFYDVEIVDLLPLTGSDVENKDYGIVKPRNTLEVLLEVYREKKTLEDACVELNIPVLSGKLIMTHWGDELPTLYTTLTQLDEKRISLDMAMARLNVAKPTLHALRRKYGFAPRSQPASLARVKARDDAKAARIAQEAALRVAQDEVALRVISGNISAYAAAEQLGMSYRTVWRCVERLTPIKINTLAAWPLSFRAALVAEISGNLPGFAEKWFKFAEESGLFLKKTPKYPKTPESWRNQPLKRLLVAVLIGEATLEEIAAARGGDPKAIATLFTGDLRPVDLTFDQVEGLPIAHQVALAELFIAISDRKRRVTP